MHDGIRRVLIASDDLDGMAEALGKARQLVAGDCSALRLLVICYDAIADEAAGTVPPTTREAVEHARLQRAREGLAELPGARDIAATALWSRETAADIIAAAGQWPADLLIKPVSPHHPVADYFHTPLDWALMREAPCPVLVTRGASWGSDGVVLAAVDAGDLEHQALSREILCRAGQLAVALGAELHVVCAYPDLGQTVSELQVATDFAGIKADMRDSRRRTLAALVISLDLDVADLHVLEGRPESVIPELARHLDARVTVLGTAARRGVAKLLLGNTAENLVGRLAGDLMTVREPWS